MNRAFASRNLDCTTPDKSAKQSAFPPHFVLEYEPDLVEAAVLRTLRGHPKERDFYRHRDPLYEIEDSEAREANFRALHSTWFVRLGLGQLVEQALLEQALIVKQVLGCKTMRARSTRDEGAELFVAAPAESQRWVVLRLRPERLEARAALLAFLRHELLHITDMLDPAYGYQPTLPPSEVGPTHDQLLRDRYGVLWDTWIDGRLMRIGWAPPAVRKRRCQAFAAIFPMLGDHMTDLFAHFFDGKALTHAELVRFASAPEAFLGNPSGSPQQGERCSLCRFPTHAFEPRPDNLTSDVLHAIRSDFPAWKPAQGICQQCAEIYRARTSPHVEKTVTQT